MHVKIQKVSGAIKQNFCQTSRKYLKEVKIRVSLHNKNTVDGNSRINGFNTKRLDENGAKLQTFSYETIFNKQQYMSRVKENSTETGKN